MADLLPSIPDASASEDAEPRVVGLDDDDAADVLGALSSTTARELFAAINEDPAHPSALADRIDTSLQNVQYHIGKLEDAGMVEVVDTAYSAKGREMDVYAPADRPLVVFAGDEEDQSLLDRALGRLLGGVGVLAGASLVLRGLARTGQTPEQPESELGSRNAGGAAPTGNDAADGSSGGDGDAPAGDGDSAMDGGGTDGGGGTDDGGMDGGSTDGGGMDDTGGMDSDGEATTDGSADTTGGGTDSTGGADTTDGGDATGGTDSTSGTGGDAGEGQYEVADPEPARDVESLAGDVAWVAEPLEVTGLPPGLALFLLGSCVLAIGTAAWYWMRQTRV